MSEIILCNIDKDISKKFPEIAVCRYVDDYSIYFTNDVSAKSINGNSILEFIRLKLLEYNLQLNESKIILTQAPFSSGKREIEQLRSIVTNNACVYLNNLLHIFNDSHDISVLRYGLKVLNYKITNLNFIDIQPLLMNLWCNYPSLTDDILNIILRFKNKIKTRELKTNIINNILYRCILYRQDNELIWVLYACQQLEIKLNSEQIKSIFETENDLAIIIILNMERNNKTKSYNDLLLKLKNDLIKVENIFYSNRWLLAYEIVKNNYLNNFNPTIDDFFKKMISLNIEFYNDKYNYDSQLKNEELGEYITREEFNQKMKDICQLISESENKEKIRNAISELNNKIESTFDNKYF